MANEWSPEQRACHRGNRGKGGAGLAWVGGAKSEPAGMVVGARECVYMCVLVWETQLAQYWEADTDLWTSLPGGPAEL